MEWWMVVLTVLGIIIAIVRGYIQGAIASRAAKNAWYKHDLGQYLRHPDQFKK